MSKAIFRQAGRAIADFNMIKNGDKVLLGLSGGKDSMSLLHILARFRRHAPVVGLIGYIAHPERHCNSHNYVTTQIMTKKC